MTQDEVMDWPNQSGKTVDTGISGKGLTSDYWKYIKNELILNDIVVPPRIQIKIDELINETPVDKNTEENKPINVFVDGLNKLSKETGLFVVGPRGVSVVDRREARSYNGHRVVKHGHRIAQEYKNINGNVFEWALDLY